MKKVVTGSGDLGDALFGLSFLLFLVMILVGPILLLAHFDGAFGTPPFSNVLEALKSPKASIRADAVRDLGKRRSWARAAIPVLLKALDDPDSNVRASAATALGKIKRRSEEVVPVLIHALQDEHPYVRTEAAHALSRFGSAAKEAIPALIRTRGVDQEIANLIMEVGSAATPYLIGATPYLMEALKDEREDVRFTAAWALSELGYFAKDAVPSLTAALDDKDRDVRREAKRALKEIANDEKKLANDVKKRANKQSKTSLREQLGTFLSGIIPPGTN